MFSSRDSRPGRLTCITRRHCLAHLAASGTAALSLAQFAHHLEANSETARKNRKACILLWMVGGVPTIDLWDMKPESKNGGELKPIPTAAPGLVICELLPQTALQMRHLSIIRSMSTREADHGRGDYFLHSGFVPNPAVVHPTFGSVVSYELRSKRAGVALPLFVSINDRGGSPGYLGMSHAPLMVNSFGQIRNLDLPPAEREQMPERLELLKAAESRFIKSGRGDMAQSHQEVSQQAQLLFSSKQAETFQVDKEAAATQDRYGRTDTGRGMLLARRLVEAGVPFVEVRCPGTGPNQTWDLHDRAFPLLRTGLPPFDQATSALVEDLNARGLYDHTAIVVMSEFGRTPIISATAGREHWANGWSVVIGGGGLKGGQTIGATSQDGMSIVDKSYQPGDVWATIAHAMGIPLNTTHTSKNGRPMKLAAGGLPIPELTR